MAERLSRVSPVHLSVALPEPHRLVESEVVLVSEALTERQPAALSAQALALAREVGLQAVREEPAHQRSRIEPLRLPGS